MCEGGWGSGACSFFFSTFFFSIFFFLADKEAKIPEGKKLKRSISLTNGLFF